MVKSVASLISPPLLLLQDEVLGQEVEESHQSGIPRDGGHSRPPTRNSLARKAETYVKASSVRLRTQLEQFLTTRINTQSRLNGSGPFNSHASSPLHSSVHQSPYSPSYLSSSFTQRDLLNGASPYHSLGGASSGYHVNSNGVTNGISPYKSVGGISDSYHVNSNFSVHTTPPARDYSSKPHPFSENSGARRKILSSSSPTPTKVGHSSPARRVRISEPSSHDDYISRLENLQQRLSGMDSGE
uniref:Uncharacterized protein n=1 Tax=Magallana gigas TaxID=29159 RepID=K1QNW0_MAGGI